MHYNLRSFVTGKERAVNTVWLFLGYPQGATDKTRRAWVIFCSKVFKLEV